MRSIVALLPLLSTLAAGQAAAPEASPPTASTVAAAPAGVRTIVLVRHGQYEIDDPRDEKVGKGLTPLGVAQARLAGTRLRGLPGGVDDLVASPLTRARQTAELVAAELGRAAPRIDPDLEECTPPTRRADVMAEEAPEALAACTAQLDRLAARLFAPASAPGPRREVVVAHGNVIRYLVTKALAVDTQAWLVMGIGHTSLTVLTVDGKGVVRVVAVGDVGHLAPSFQTGAAGDPDRSLALPR